MNGPPVLQSARLSTSLFLPVRPHVVVVHGYAADSTNLGE
jgi:hypothetical protein